MPPLRADAKVTTLARIALVSVALLLVPALLLVQRPDGPAASSEDVQQQRYCTAGSCDREMSSDARSIVAALQRQGLTCRAEPRLTDRVVVEWSDGRAETISFARALGVSAQGDGWLRSFCGPLES